MSEERIKNMNISKVALENFRAAFNVLDLDKSGAINEEELLIGLQSVGSNPTHEQLKLMLAAADIDDSGDIDFSEFIVVMVNEQKRRIDSIENPVDRKDNASTNSMSSIDSCSGTTDGFRMLRKEKDTPVRSKISLAKVAPLV